MAKIKEITARKILNANGNPTVETTLVLNNGVVASSSVPSGISAGNYEAAAIKDIEKAISSVKDQIAPRLLGFDVEKQQEIDRLMIDLDGTQNKSRLGANATISVSMSVAKAAAQSSVLPLFLYLRGLLKSQNPTDSIGSLKIPTPIFNLMSGGNESSENLDFKDVLLVPASSKTFSQSLEIGVNVYKALKKSLRTNNQTVSTNQEALTLLKNAIDQSSLRNGFDAFLGLDANASAFYQDGSYRIKDTHRSMSARNLVDYYAQINKDFHLLYLEDPLSQDDWEGWIVASRELGTDSIIVGDNLTATNPYRLQMAMDKKAITGIAIKPSQIGTVMETLAVFEIARQVGLKTVVGTRTEETNDDFIADFAVAVSSDYMRMGAPVKGENVAKYNRLSQIESQLKLL